MKYINELLADGNTTVLDTDRAAFMTACAAQQLNVIVTDEADYKGHVYTRYDLVSNGNEDTATDQTAEPSLFALVADRVKTYTVKTAQRCAFVLSLAAVGVVAFSVCFGSALLVLGLCDACNLSRAVRAVLSLVVLIGPALELAANVEYNLIAAVARLFPSFFWRPLPFERFSFWGRMCRA